MSQSKWASAAEQLMNQAVGNVISWCLNYFMLPLLGMPQSIGRATLITLIFSVTSFVRGYMLRRLFNWLENNQAKVKKVSLLRGLLAKKKFEPKVVPVVVMTPVDLDKLLPCDKTWLMNYAGYYKIHETIEPVIAQYVYRAGSAYAGWIKINRKRKPPVYVKPNNTGAFWRKFKKIASLQEATYEHRYIIAYMSQK